MKHLLLLLTFAAFTTTLFTQSFRSSSCQGCKSGAVQTEAKVFPNPATEYIELSASNRATLLIIFNLVGREIKRFTIKPKHRYYIGNLPNGLYLVQILDEKNQPLATLRLSKK